MRKILVGMIVFVCFLASNSVFGIDPHVVLTAEFEKLIKSKTVIYRNGFNNNSVGPFTMEALQKDWNLITMRGDKHLVVDGIVEGRASVVTLEDESWKCLRISYPANQFGPKETGAQWWTYVGKHEKLFLTYFIKFGDSFNFKLGGKLPGLGGGMMNTGGEKATGYDGFSVRLMWRKNGILSAYVYHPDASEANGYGDNFYFTRNDGVKFSFVPLRSYMVEVGITMSNPGEHNGVVEGWVDGEKMLEAKGFCFRKTPDLSINAFMFSTFFGGNTQEWATSKDEEVYFTNFIISTEPISKKIAEIMK